MVLRSWQNIFFQQFSHFIYVFRWLHLSKTLINLLISRSLDSKPILFDSPELAILISNSNVKHELSTGQYAQRRQECEKAAAVIGKKKLREGTMEDLKRKHKMIPIHLIL